MKVAVAIDHRSEISAHFGRSPAFLVCTVRDGRIEQREVRANDQALPKARPPTRMGTRMPMRTITAGSSACWGTAEP